MNIGYITDKGKSRDNNEDSYYVNEDFGLFIAADGVGGQNAGEIASRLAVETISSFLIEKCESGNLSGNYIFKCINSAVNEANARILEKSMEKPEYFKMATTAVIVMLRGEKAYIGNIGDSRAYLIRNGRIIRITEDHTMANQLIREGRLTEEEVEFLAQKQLALNMFCTITRALGDENGAEADNFFIEIQKNDIFLLCSDGLYGEVSDDDIADTIINAESIQRACEQLAEKANENGGRDNITAIIIEIGEKYHE